MHVTMCPRLSLMYAMPLVSGLWSLVFGLWSDYSDYSEYSDYSDYSDYSEYSFKKEGMPESTPSNHLKTNSEIPDFGSYLPRFPNIVSSFYQIVGTRLGETVFALAQ